jgi:hypothetical protein
VLYQDVEWSPTHFFLGSSHHITATVYWNSMKDIPIEVNDEIPLY